MTPQIQLPIKFRPHAVENYRERVRPGLSIADAEIELHRIAAHARVEWKAPAWLGGSSRQDVTMFLTIADAVFPLAPSEDGTCLAALTCRVKGSISPSVRETRNQRRRSCTRRSESQLQP